MLFIVIHQVYELWFKETAARARSRRCAARRRRRRIRAQHTLKRILTILKVLVAQVDILETMTPLEFLTFRARLEAASGFQSDQFRQLEFALGRKRADALARFPEGSRRAHGASERRYREPTLWDAFLHYLAARGLSPCRRTHLARDVTRSRSRRHPRSRTILDPSIATTRRTPSSASASSISTKGSRSGAIATSRWSSGRSARNRAPADRRARIPAEHARPSPFPRPVGDPGAPVAADPRADRVRLWSASALEVPWRPFVRAS